MNVEIGAEAALFPAKEYINGIAFAVFMTITCWFLFHCSKTQEFLFLLSSSRTVTNFIINRNFSFILGIKFL
jgi:hypothetical protein